MKFMKHYLNLFFISLFTFSLVLPGNLVLCNASVEGHIEIEVAHDNACGVPQSHTHLDQENPQDTFDHSADCFPCFDIPLPDGQPAFSEKASSKVSPRTFFVFHTRFQRKFMETPVSKNHNLSIPPPRKSSALLALRSVILLV
jgi:hypothetical protein